MYVYVYAGRADKLMGSICLSRIFVPFCVYACTHYFTFTRLFCVCARVCMRIYARGQVWYIQRLSLGVFFPPLQYDMVCMRDCMHVYVGMHLWISACVCVCVYIHTSTDITIVQCLQQQSLWVCSSLNYNSNLSAWLYVCVCLHACSWAYEVTLILHAILSCMYDCVHVCVYKYIYI